MTPVTQKGVFSCFPSRSNLQTQYKCHWSKHIGQDTPPPPPIPPPPSWPPPTAVCHASRLSPTFSSHTDFFLFRIFTQSTLIIIKMHFFIEFFAARLLQSKLRGCLNSVFRHWKTSYEVKSAHPLPNVTDGHQQVSCSMPTSCLIVAPKFSLNLMLGFLGWWLFASPALCERWHWH